MVNAPAMLGRDDEHTDCRAVNDQAPPSLANVSKDLRSLVKAAIAQGWTLEWYGPARSRTGANAVSPDGNVKVMLPKKAAGATDRLSKQARSMLRKYGVTTDGPKGAR